MPFFAKKNAIFAAEKLAEPISVPKKNVKIGLVDADLLCNGTRHPNLALMKLSGSFIIGK